MSGGGDAFAEARLRAGAAASAARAACAAMLAEIDATSEHDELAELMVAVTLFGEAYRDIRAKSEDAALAWLRDNPSRIREIRVGDFKWWGEKVKSVRCLDVGNAGAAAAGCMLWGLLIQACGGGVAEGDDPERSAEDQQRAAEAAESILHGIADLFRKVVSSGGLKEAATREVLGDGAERAVRAQHEQQPIEQMPGETPEEALQRAIMAARVAAWLDHFEETWPDKLEGGEPKKKLGVANLRFVHRVGGGTKQELEQIDREATARAVAGEG